MNVLLTIFGVIMFFTAVFLILLVLVQRGRGGGLTGALGGMGGQSAFGSKAGDVFTRITVVMATFWILLCIAMILLFNRQPSAQAGPDAKEGPSKEFELVQPTDSESEPEAGAGIDEATPASAPKEAGDGGGPAPSPAE